MIYEPDVTLTDYGLAIMCALFARVLLRHDSARPAMRNWFASYFTAVAAASFLGGTVHGFVPAVESAGYRALWPATLFAIGTIPISAHSVGGNNSSRQPILNHNGSRLFISRTRLMAMPKTITNATNELIGEESTRTRR